MVSLFRPQVIATIPSRSSLYGASFGRVLESMGRCVVYFEEVCYRPGLSRLFLRPYEFPRGSLPSYFRVFYFLRYYRSYLLYRNERVPKLNSYIRPIGCFPIQARSVTRPRAKSHVSFNGYLGGGGSKVFFRFSLRHVFLQVFCGVRRTLVCCRGCSLCNANFRGFFRGILECNSPYEVVKVARRGGVQLFSFRGVQVVFLCARVVFLFRVVSTSLATGASRYLFVLHGNEDEGGNLL